MRFLACPAQLSKHVTMATRKGRLNLLNEVGGHEGRALPPNFGNFLIKESGDCRRVIRHHLAVLDEVLPTLRESRMIFTLGFIS